MQFAEFTGLTSPLESLQSQNQYPQSSSDWHVTFVAPEGLLDPPELELELELDELVDPGSLSS